MRPSLDEFAGGDAALHASMEWAVADVLTYAAVGSQVPGGLPMPHWSWDGPQA